MTISALLFRFPVGLTVPVSAALLLGITLACSSEDTSPDNTPSTGGQSSGGQTGGGQTGGTSSSSGGTPAASGGASTGNGVVGTFSVLLNPAVEAAAEYTSILGKVYTAEYPTDVVETPSASAGGCTTYRFSRQPCLSVQCTPTQTCAAPDECRDLPTLVNVGTVSVTGIGSAPLTLSGVNKNYQYAGEIPFPGFDEGSTISLSATGDHYGAFTVTTTGVAPVTLTESDYLLSSGKPLLVEWEAGTNSDADISIVLNISKHGGSAGYMRCDTTDSGSFTIPAAPIQSLIDLGVAGFPQLTLTRRTAGETQVASGKIVLEVAAQAIPTLAVEGYCSCNDSVDCGSCSDSTKTSCDSLRRLCRAP